MTRSPTNRLWAAMPRTRRRPGACKDSCALAKNCHYGFDFCPAFWDWIDHAHQAGTVFSIDKVAIELDAVDDDLATWASERPDAFFLEADAAVVPSLQATSTWANGAGYEPHLSCPELPGPSATVRRFTV